MKGLALTFPFISMSDMNEMLLPEFLTWLEMAKDHNDKEKERMEQR